VLAEVAGERERETERDASACMRRHQASALAPMVFPYFTCFACERETTGSYPSKVLELS
jgi:hypothetical protein